MSWLKSVIIEVNDWTPKTISGEATEELETPPKDIKIPIEAGETIKDVKIKIQYKYGIDILCQRFYASNSMKMYLLDEEIGRLDDETKLVDFGLGKIARHGILLRYGFEENPIILTVFFEKIPFHISIGLFRDTSVLYQYVSKAAGLSVSNFDIIYKGKELRAGKSLSSHGIKNQSKLEVNFKQIEYSTKTRNPTG